MIVRYKTKDGFVVGFRFFGYDYILVFHRSEV